MMKTFPVSFVFVFINTKVRVRVRVRVSKVEQRVSTV